MYVPWRPTYSMEDAREAIAGASSWADALRRLGRRPYGKNVATLRKWAGRWGIDCSHLPAPSTATRNRYTEAEAREAIAASRSWAEALRRLGYCHTGGNPRTLKKRAEAWGISTAHFDAHAASREALRRRPKTPLAEILVEGSTYSRSSLKQRLYAGDLKQPICELCGQGEIWKGRRMGMILDHVNGIRDDNRIENLRIVCPNCAATLETHCGRKNRIEVVAQDCLRCGKEFMPNDRRQKYCSRYCGVRWHRTGRPNPGARKVKRPPEAQLLREIEELGYLAVGRKYGVSDNAVRKWARAFARARAREEGHDPEVVEIPTRTWPNRKKRAA